MNTNNREKYKNFIKLFDSTVFSSAHKLFPKYISIPKIKLPINIIIINILKILSNVQLYKYSIIKRMYKNAINEENIKNIPFISDNRKYP